MPSSRSLARPHLLLSCIIFLLLGCPTPPDETGINNSLVLSQQLTEQYTAYRNPSITSRRFRLADIQPAIDALPEPFTVSVAGHSIQNRKLNRVSWGEGETQVLLWSQMHGNEPTATAALLDIFNWLGASNDGMDAVRALLHEQLSLTFLPMLNPDGAEVFKRRNALNVDLNRDALRLQSPEAQLLKEERDRLQADWGFNLHDQSIYYGVGFPASRGAAISILAPAYDWEKSTDAKREDAMQLIALMNRHWQTSAPGGIGRYNDDFEPRAFGDNLQKWGTRTILIESGGWPGDPEKQELRKMNFSGIILALHGIATNSYESATTEEYWEIPENESNAVFDLIIEKVSLAVGEAGPYQVDIGIRRPDRLVPGPENWFYRDGVIQDLGDLHTFLGITKLDGSSLEAVAGAVYPDVLTQAELLALNPVDLYRQGFTAVRLSDYQEENQLALPQLRLLTEEATISGLIAPGHATDLLLHQDGEVVMAVVFGRVIEL